MSRNLSRLLVLSVLVLAIFSFPQFVQRAHAATGLVCIAPDLPGQTACPASPVALTGPVSSGPPSLIRIAVFIAGTDSMNGFEVTLHINHLVALPIGVDLTGSIVGAGPTVLLECIQNVATIGGPCQTTDTLDTIHIAVVEAVGGPPIPNGSSGLLFTAIYQIQSATTVAETIGFQTGCTVTSVATTTTCINISNGTTIPDSETGQTGTLTSSTTQPSLQLSPASTNLGNAFPGTAIPAQTVTTTDMNGYGPWQFNGGIAGGDTTISYAVTIAGPTSSSTGITATFGAPNPQDFSTSTGAGFSVTNSLSFTNAATTTSGLWTITVTGTYHFDPNCVSGVSCPGPASTLAEAITYTVTIEDFGFTLNGAASGTALLPFWCPAASMGTACPAGQSGVGNILVTPKGYTGTVTLANSVPSPATSPALAASLSTGTIAGASGSAIDTFSGGLLRPTTTIGAYSVSVTATGTLLANGVFPAQTKPKSISVIVRPQDFTLLASTGTSTGPAISFASGSSATDLTSLASLPTGSTALNAAGFAGPVTLSSVITGGTGLTVAFATSPVALTGGGTATDLVTFSGSVTTTTTFTVTITGTASIATSNPGTQTQSVTYSVMIMGAAKDATSTSISCTPGSINVGQTSLCTASVADTTTPSSIPTGTVTFTLNAGTTGGSLSSTTCTLSAAGSCTSTFQGATAAGSATVGASYGGDMTHNPSTSATSATITVAKSDTATVVTCTPTSISTTQTSSCQGAVSSLTPGSPLTGTITFTLNAGTTGGTLSSTTCTLLATASCSVTFQGSTAAGTATVGASYGGDTTHNGSTSATLATITVTVSAHSTSTSVSCGAAIVVNEIDTCTVTVTDTNAAPTTPSGTVSFAETGLSAGSFTGSPCSLTASGAAGAATCTVTFSSTATGGANVVATYSGDSAHSGSDNSAAAFVILVGVRSVSVTVSCVPSSITATQTSQCTATVTDTSPGAPTSFATNTVTFGSSDLSATFTPNPCTISGTTATVTCVATYTPSSAGTASITAHYDGSPTHAAVLSSGFSLTVNAAVTITTALSQTTITVGGSVTDSATLSGNTATAGGTVTYSFFSGSTCGGTGTVVGSPVTVTSGVVPISASQSFNSAGSFSWHAAYSGDTNNSPATSACEPLTVNPSSGAAISTTLSATSLTVGGSVTDSATLTGVTSNAGGTVTYSFFTGPSCAGTGTPVGSPVTVTGGVVPSSSSQAFNAAGSFSWNAVYSGDANNGGATSGCEPLTVNKASPTITTSLVSNPIPVGGSVTDSATLTGSFQAGGTVTYSFFTGSTCAGTATVVGSAVTVTSGVVPNSAAQAFNTAGSFSWNAAYSGDANNNGASSTCEPLTVNKASPTISTTLSSSTISAGGSVSDSATLAGGFQASGTVTYSFFTGSTCSGTGTPVGTPVTVTGGVVPGSASQLFPSAGSFSWNAVYSGDVNNNGAPSACEPLTVNPAGGAVLSTTLSATSITVGGSVSDSATLTGVTANAGGTVTYNFFSGSTCTGTATPVGSPVTVTAGVVPNSASQTFNTAGSFSWNAVYSGDSNNAGTTSGCEPLTVNQAVVTVTTSLTPSFVVVGGSMVDSATLSGNTATAGGTVTYNVFRTSGSCSGNPDTTSVVTVTSGVVPNSASETFTSVSPASWNAVYSGDSNNMGATSACEPFTIQRATVSVSTALSATTISAGGSVSDTATLTGGFQAGGSVTYLFFTGSTCAGTGTTVGTPVTVSGGVVPASASQSFPNAGSFSWNAVYSGDGNNAGATSSCEPLTVNAVSVVAISTTLSSASVAVGGSVTDSATLTGVTTTAGGTVAYSFFTGTACSGTPTAVGAPVTVTNGAVPNSGSQAFNTAGSFSWNAVYSGDANNAGATSACEPLTVNQAIPTLATTLSANPITQGGTVTDSATLTGGFQASGTVTYSFFSGSTCSGTATAVGSPVTVTNGVVPNSAPQTFSSPGLFSFQASYSGDTNNKAATSNCEPLTVNSIVPVTITTTLSSTSITVGGSVFDTATLSGVTANAGGTVTYVLSAGSTCGTGRFVGNPVTVTNGLVPNSDPVTFTIVPPGPVSWSAMYSGDANNPSAASQCEPMTVNPASPSMSTTLSSSQITAGQSVTDSAVLTNSFQAGGTVTYNMFATADCSGTSTTVSTVTVTNSVVPDSASQAFNTAGSFSWNAVYSGDGNNMGATSGCELLTVSSVTGAPFLLTFQAFNFTAFHNGIGPFTVLVNGHVVVVFPGHAFVSSSSTTAFGTNKWVSLGPYDITAFVIPGQNNVTFVNTFGIRFSLIRNVMITQGDTTFLNFKGPRFISSEHSLTLTFSNPPLVITSLTFTGTLVTDGSVTFTASYKGGTGPFRCVFLFGDDEAAFTTGGATSCSVTHDFDDSGTVNVRVIVIGSSTSDRVSSSISITIAGSSDSAQLTTGMATRPQLAPTDDD